MASLPPARRTARISVVTVVRNGAATIDACLRSVREQRYPELEHVVVDGASTDGTMDLLRRAPAERLRWISEPDRGIYDAMNKGVRLASGDYLLFLGADDALLADLEAVAARLVDPHTIYYGDAYWPSRHRLYDGRFGPLKLAIRNICQQAIFYPRAAFEKRVFDPRFPIAADWEFNMRCLSAPGLRFEYIPVLVATFDDVKGASSRGLDPVMYDEYPVLLHRHFPARVAVPLGAAVAAIRFARRLGLVGKRR